MPCGEEKPLRDFVCCAGQEVRPVMQTKRNCWKHGHNGGGGDRNTAVNEKLCGGNNDP